MKNVLFLSLVFLGSILLSCSTQDEVKDQSNQSSDIIALFDSMTTNSNGTDYGRYDLTIDQQNNVQFSNYGVIERTRHSETYWALKKQTNSLTINVSEGQQRVQVCCTVDGENFDCEDCPEGANQSLCIIRLINECLDQDGCASVCEMRVIHNPVLNEFYVVKD